MESSIKEESTGLDLANYGTWRGKAVKNDRILSLTENVTLNKNSKVGRSCLEMVNRFSFRHTEFKLTDIQNEVL